MNRWRVLGLLALAELLGMSLWFTATAVTDDLGARWSLTSGESAWLATAVNLGFVAGTAVAAALNVADVVRSRTCFAWSAALAALANAAVLAAPGFGEAVALRFATGFLLAGVYPPAMKMAATWFKSARGLAIGTIVGALTVGKATPYLVRALPAAGADAVVLTASGGALAGGLLVLALYRDGPHAFRRAPFSWGRVASVVRSRETRLAIWGYLGHMWELYAMWAWTPVYLAASAAARSGSLDSAAAGADAALDRTSAAASSAGAAAVDGALVDLAGFAALAAGGLGCVWGGWAADRIGRERLAAWAMAASGACCVASGLVFGQPFWLAVGFAVVWGFFVVADSAQFSALVTETAPPESVGTALTVQTCLGFLLAAATVQVAPAVAAAVGWRWAFAGLALGPAAGIVAIRRLRRVRTEAAQPPSSAHA